MRVAGKSAESSEVGESVDEGRLENCSTKTGMIKSLSQGQFAAREKKKRGWMRESLLLVMRCIWEVSFLRLIFINTLLWIDK